MFIEITYGSLHRAGNTGPVTLSPSETAWMRVDDFHAVVDPVWNGGGEAPPNLASFVRAAITFPHRNDITYIHLVGTKAGLLAAMKRAVLEWRGVAEPDYVIPAGTYYVDPSGNLKLRSGGA